MLLEDVLDAVDLILGLTLSKLSRVAVTVENGTI
jgi:hypothetical protein